VKITGETTLSLLEARLEALGRPHLALRRLSGLGDRRYLAIVTGDGAPCSGSGPTVARAIDVALAEYAHSPQEADYGPQCEAKGQCEDVDGSGTCFGCGRWLGGYANDPPAAPKIGEIVQPHVVAAIASRTEAAIIPGFTTEALKPARDPALCFGCGHARADHPNDSGCEVWHDSSERDRELAQRLDFGIGQAANSIREAAERDTAERIAKSCHDEGYVDAALWIRDGAWREHGGEE